MVRLMGVATADERIIAASPKDAEGLAKTEALNAVLREFSPLCCFVGDDALRPIYEEAGVPWPS